MRQVVLTMITVLAGCGRSAAAPHVMPVVMTSSSVHGARATIVHENEMGRSFRLIKVVYALDGTLLFRAADDTNASALGMRRSFEVFDGLIAPGQHTLSLLLVYRGHGEGVFSYLDKYKFTVRASQSVVVADGRDTQITVFGVERGHATTPLEQRPAVDFEIRAEHG